MKYETGPGNKGVLPPPAAPPKSSNNPVTPGGAPRGYNKVTTPKQGPVITKQ